MQTPKPTMWDWIAHHPLKLVIYAAIPSAVLIYASFVLPAQRRLLKLGVGLMICAVALGVAGWMAETDEDAIRNTLYAAAHAVERNDIDTAVSYIAGSNRNLRSRAKSELTRYKFFRVAVKSNLTIDIDRSHDPPRAVARFNVVAVLASKDGALGRMNVPRFVILRFEKEGDTWRITGFEHDRPLPNMRQ